MSRINKLLNRNKYEQLLIGINMNNYEQIYINQNVLEYTDYIGINKNKAD